MNKRLLVILLLCLIPLSMAYAATTHYSYSTPTVGGSQNTWGSTLNTIFGQIDGNIWSASGGTTIGLNAVTTGSNIALTNPISSVQNLAFTTTGKKVALPLMNATASPVAGGVIYFNNTGSNAFDIVASDNSTAVVTALAAGKSVSVQALTNSTSNGTFTTYGPYLSSVSGNISLGTAVSSANPAISTDATTGLYTPGAAQVAVSISGVQRLLWNSSGETIAGGVGMSGALNFTASSAVPTNGVYSSAANAISLSTSGSMKATVAADGGVTVGSPTGGSKGLGTVNIAGAGYYINGSLSTGGISNITGQTFTASGTYTPTSGMKYAVVQCVGGGGGSAGSQASTNNGSGGGGSGGYLQVIVSAAQIGASKAVTIGAAGSAGAASPSAGGAGGASSLGTMFSCGGGNGSAVGAGQGTTNVGGTGGTNTVTTGTAVINFTGQSGGTGGQAASSWGGAGGSNPLGAGGPISLQAQGSGTGLAGAVGTGYGAGASGSGTQTTSTGGAGAAGTAGYIAIIEYQ